MKLSIIIPAYNAETTIRQCLDSVLSQTVPDTEVWVVNDGSTDQTADILAEYGARFPETLHVRTVENGGQGRARNVALELAAGEFIGFADSDDWVEPDMFEKLIALAEAEGCDLVHCDVTAHFPDGSTAPEAIYRPERPMASAGFANNKLFRRELIASIRFPEEKLWYEDLEFTARCIHRARKEAHLHEALYHYRRGLPSTMNNQNARKNLDILTVMEHLEEELLPEARDDFEFLILNHILLDAMNRVQAMDAEEKRDVLFLMREYVRFQIPRLSQCRSFREETRNRRLVMRLNALGLTGLSETLLNLKGAVSS